MKRLLWKLTLLLFSRSHTHWRGHTPWAPPGLCWHPLKVHPLWQSCCRDGVSHATDHSLNYMRTWPWMKSCIFPMSLWTTDEPAQQKWSLLLWFSSLGHCHHGGMLMLTETSEVLSQELPHQSLTTLGGRESKDFHLYQNNRLHSFCIIIMKGSIYYTYVWPLIISLWAASGHFST